MPGSQVDRKLEEWRQVAREADLSSRPPRSKALSGIGTALGGALVLLVIVLAIRPAPSGVAGAPGASASARTDPASPPRTTLPSASGVSGSVMPPAASAGASPSAPADGGCSSGQFDVGPATTGAGGSTFGTESVYVRVPITNTGPQCVLRVPATVLLSSSGTIRAVHLANAMTSPTYVAKAGKPFTAVLGAWWPYPGSPPIPGCTAPVPNIGEVSIELPSGRLLVTLDKPWAQACTSPATVSLEYAR
jgi:hypothetical protein